MPQNEIAASLARDGFGPDEIAAMCSPTASVADAPDPTPLRWGLNDVMWGDDNSVTVLLSGPGGEPYWLELGPERAAVLRQDLAGPPVDQAALRDRIAAALYDHSHPGWAISFPDLDQDQRDTYLSRADAVLAVLPASVDQAALVRACASFVRDTYSGEWADDAAATLETDADKIERGEPCSLLRLAAVLPATTNHDTDTAPAATCSAQYHGPGEDRARLCIRAAQHQRTAHTDEHGFHWSDTVAMYPVADGTFRIGTDVRAELRRVADETAATETDAEPTAEEIARDHVTTLHLIGEQLSTIEGWFWEHLADVREAKQPAAGARQDGERP